MAQKLVVLAVALLGCGLEWKRRRYLISLPSDQQHEWQVLNQIWTPAEIEKLHRSLRSLGEREGIPNGDSYGYGRWPLTEHVGEAEPLMREALAGRRSKLGDGHPETLMAMNNLAELLQKQGKLGEAEPLMRVVTSQTGGVPSRPRQARLCPQHTPRHRIGGRPSA